MLPLCFLLLIIIRNFRWSEKRNLASSAAGPAQFLRKQQFSRMQAFTHNCHTQNICVSDQLQKKTSMFKATSGTYRCERHVKGIPACESHLTTTFSRLVWHWKATTWRWLTALLGLGLRLRSIPYKDHFLFVWQVCHIFQACHIQL